MKHREFGLTGTRVSALGFGAMRLPTIGEGEEAPVDLDKAVPLLQRGMDLGINFIDSAWGYLNRTSEIAVGEAIAGRKRSSIYISTKNPVDTDVVEWRKRLDIQLKRLKTDYIDFYHIHATRWDAFKNKVIPEGYMQEMHIARDEGIIRHISFSSHDTPKNIIKIIDSGEFSSMLVQYNLLHRYNDVAIAYARQKGLGVAVMGPVGGGRINFMSRLHPREGRTIPELALRFALANPNVSTALSGMSTIAMVEENCSTASLSGPLGDVENEDIKTMLDQLQGLDELYCTGCGYCMPCPNGVNIPTNFFLYNYDVVYGPSVHNVAGYHDALKPAERSANFCIECGECVEKCPQDIPIPERLRDVAEHFEKRKTNDNS